MIGIVPLAIGIGLVVSLLFTEFFGIAAGGMVVPGYLALHLTRPMDVALTLGTGFVTFAVVQALSTFVVVYGRRRIVLMILVGFVLGMLVRWAAQGFLAPHLASADIIGYIIPGLIALWCARQGVIETMATAVTAAVIVRLVLLIAVGEDLGS